MKINFAQMNMKNAYNYFALCAKGLKMGCNYAGRLGRIIEKYPKVQCEKCGTFQVQIINYLDGDAGYKCRHCKHEFTLPFKDCDES